jgi:hypothetical protein
MSVRGGWKSMAASQPGISAGLSFGARSGIGNDAAGWLARGTGGAVAK